MYEDVRILINTNKLHAVKKNKDKTHNNELEQTFRKKIKICVIGNLNVGKSTLINKLIEKNRTLVQNAYGTTRDPIFIHHLKKNNKYIVIDTAGIRKKSKTKKLMEHLSIIKSLKAINISNIVILVIDITKSIRKQDLSLIQYVYKSGKSLVIFFNKSDLLKLEEKYEIRNSIKKILFIYKNIKYFFISALKDKSFGFIWNEIDKLYDISLKDYPVKKINLILKKAVFKLPPPVINSNKQIKLKYAHIGGKNPLIIIIHGYQTRYVNTVYRRYLENFFYNHLSLKGIRVEIQFKDQKLLK